MKNNLLKFVGIISVLLLISNVYACDEFWYPGCSSSATFNIEIQNDTNYVLKATAVNTHPNHPTIFPTYFQNTNTIQTIIPSQNFVFPIEGDLNNAGGSGLYSPGMVSISAQVSADQTNSVPLDSLTPSFYAGFQTCSNVNPGTGTSSDYPCNGQWTSSSWNDAWVINPNGISGGSMLGISRNVYMSGNNVIYDYTTASSQPSNSPPPGQNPWGNKQYAPSPYQNN